MAGEENLRHQRQRPQAFEQRTGNSNEIRKPTVAATILLTKDVGQRNGLYTKTMIKYDCLIPPHFLPLRKQIPYSEVSPFLLMWQ